MIEELFVTLPSLRIGKIVEVSGNQIRIELDIRITELTRSVYGQVYSIGQIGSIIKIHFGRKILFAYVRMLRMQSDILAEEGKTTISPGDDKRILEADLFGQGVWSSKDRKLAFVRGVETYPLPLQDSFLCLNDELESIYRAAEDLRESEDDPMVPIGNYVGGNNAVCRANIDKLFGHHCAILGSTGSGKSGTVASILHSVLSHQTSGKNISPRIVIIDPHGEYAKAFEGKAIVYKAYNEASTTAMKTEQLKLPYWLMSSDEFRSLVIGKTEFEATSQTNMVHQAVTYARLFNTGLVENVGLDPLGEANSEVPCAGKTESDILNFDRDKPVPFQLSEVIKHLDKVQGRKANESKSLTPSDKNRQSIESILKKLKVLRSNPQLSFLMEEHSAKSPTLETVLHQFVGGVGDKNLRIVDISGLPNEVAGPLTALIARLLFQYKLWQTRDEREKDPVLFICEEAHRYVPNHGEAQYKEAQEAVRRIAKEGRKYGIGLMLISQRPSDVEATVLSQCNSWIILRLTNSSDQEHVSRFLPDSLVGLTKMLPSLTRREAIFVGEAAALPSRIRINKLSRTQLPDSNDISFVKGWVNKPTKSIDLEKVSKRWVGA
ncbi:ATP-binding protein [Imperialibacter roseus]|uniref:ATP-binding protein n=1 Tax=Imperialibacter roseus TaxID=1324217 RepID=A0ABZ0IJ75_9BACT|nr:ATP-binding protein [Imperialibacter roseus]WOK04741.1 ATP-binding protein [Imperialibacter roseus]